MSNVNYKKGKLCACGKNHDVPLPEVVSKSGAISLLPLYIDKFKAKKVFLLADTNTFKAAGEKAEEILKSVGVTVEKFVFPAGEVKPDEKAVGAAVMRYKADSDVVISVGSGVINDIGKLVSATAGVPYIVIATAPSMDGYASATSSMERDGLKASLPSKCADVIIGDTDILKAAPMKMLKAGLGDMLAKYVSIGEWRIAHEITGEYYCEEIASDVRVALKKCVDNADGLLKREEAATEAVFEGLILCGEAMTKAGVSRPASGVEHYFSHIWDMRGLEFGIKTEFHGLQCAVGTYYAAGIYDELAKITPDEKKAREYAEKFDYGKWSAELKEFLGKGADAMIAAEKYEGKYDVAKHSERLEVILKKWDALTGIMRDEIPSQKQIGEILDKVGMPKTAEELGLVGDLKKVFKATKDIRDKYVGSRLCFDLGVIDEIF